MKAVVSPPPSAGAGTKTRPEIETNRTKSKVQAGPLRRGSERERRRSSEETHARRLALCCSQWRREKLGQGRAAAWKASPPPQLIRHPDDLSASDAAATPSSRNLLLLRRRGPLLLRRGAEGRLLCRGAEATAWEEEEKGDRVASRLTTPSRARAVASFAVTETRRRSRRGPPARSRAEGLG